MPLNDAPHSRIVHGVIAVDDAIAKADYARQLIYAAGRDGIRFSQAVEGLSDNLELALDGATKLTVIDVIGKAPVHHSRMLRPDVRTSNNSFFARFSIHELASRLHLAPQVRVANRLFRNQVDWPSEELLERVSKCQKAIRVCGVRSPIRHLDEKIKIARRAAKSSLRR